MSRFEVEAADREAVRPLLVEHMERMAYPMDSWLEEMITKADHYHLTWDGSRVGYMAVKEKTIRFFYVQRPWYRYAPRMLEEAVERFAAERILVLTQDHQISALVAEWDFDKEKLACWFIDSGIVRDPSTRVDDAVFRPAEERDEAVIREVCGDFFDDSIGTIYVLERDGSFLGAGIMEPSVYRPGLASIGMFANPACRRQGVAKRILLCMKEAAYAQGMVPAAGCWYYNTLSRMSLEAAGMVATSIGYEAILRGKEKPPMRTGNPPGVLVDW